MSIELFGFGLGREGSVLLFGMVAMSVSFFVSVLSWLAHRVLRSKQAKKIKVRRAAITTSKTSLFLDICVFTASVIVLLTDSSVNYSEQVGAFLLIAAVGLLVLLLLVILTGFMTFEKRIGLSK